MKHPAMFANTSDAQLSEFEVLCSQTTQLADYPHATDVQKNVLIYEGTQLRQWLSTAEQRQTLLTEMHHALANGPGVLVIKHGFDDLTVVDRQTAVFEQILELESRSGIAADHFAKAGANSRIWNSFQKAANIDPDAFIDYYSNPLIDLACEAWLGPCYQMTAQVNVVKPGGEAQQPHRDYHLGFQVEKDIEAYPLNIQRLSQFLTLQGAVAHSDMPLASGPTLLLPYSQQYELGYLAWRKAEFREYFWQHHVQLPLEKGDLIFFSPALFHAAGHNTTSHFHRIANLLQVSSAFGKPMETIDHASLMKAIYPTLREKWLAGHLSQEAAALAIKMSADGYSFPTNLDKSPPVGGLAPQTGQQLLQLALAEEWSISRFKIAVAAHFQARQV